MENRTRIKGGNPAGLTLKTSIGQPANDGALSNGVGFLVVGDRLFFRVFLFVLGKEQRSCRWLHFLLDLFPRT